FELSLRAWRLGWKCYYEHFAICRHKTSVTIKSIATKKKIAVIYNRNKMFLHAIHLSGYQKILWLMQLVGEAFIYIVTLRWYYFNALKMFIKGRSRVVQSRKNFDAITHNRVTKPIKDVTDELISSLQ